VFNSAVALGVPASDLTAEVDSVSFCFSKGLSAPIGSALCGSFEFVERARKWRKMLGGGMRQVGVLAAAGIVGLEQMIPRLAEDHENAQRLAKGLAGIPGIVIDPTSIQTNIVFFEWQGGSGGEFLAKVNERGLKISGAAPRFRMVTHWDINGEDIEEALEIIAAAAKEATTAKV
jgi:threonine aldolase